MRRPTEDPESRDRELSRRDFVRLSAMAVGGAAVGGCGTAGSQGPTTPDPEVPVEPTASVAAVRGTDLYSMTRDVLEGVGGIESVVHEGETVFIKPNMVTLPWASNGNVFHNGECTKPEILIATAEECLRVGAAEVVIGDGSQMASFDWTEATTLDGSTNLVVEAERLSTEYAGNCWVACLEADSPAWDEVPSSTYLGTIATSSLVTRADHVITVPVAKTHCWAQLTLGLKNFVGVTSLARYAGTANDRGVVFDHGSTRSIAEIYLDVVRGAQVDLSIIDFSIGIEGDGPTTGHSGRTVDMRDRLGSWLLLASTDVVAADAMAAQVMNHNPHSITQLYMASSLGLGEYRPDYIELVGADLDDLRVAWAPAVLRNRIASCPFSGPHFAARSHNRPTGHMV
ncbi:MAG: DUF362 domain-containing protein [Gemmatimonadetes bacterium]|nr:DUF362 domain-containing protein [Gemmatimonadota bacterium]NIO30567.1 DUF362 domain-containing protein [Gemmatimonadota bacterium]